VSVTQSAEPLGRFLGGQLRRIREERGGRQEDISASLRALGLPWDRTAVASFEIGRRAVRLEEALLCCVAYNVALADILRAEPDTWLQIGGQRVSAGTVANIVAGGPTISVASKATAIAGPSEAERRAAHQLGIAPLRLVIASEKAWGRRLDAERDRRLKKTEPRDDPAVQRALRGHITRQLVEELRASLPHRRRRGG